MLIKVIICIQNVLSSLIINSLGKFDFTLNPWMFTLFYAFAYVLLQCIVHIVFICFILSIYSI